jgi:hypothetical protein
LTDLAEPPAAPSAATPRRTGRALPTLPLLVAGCFALAALSLLLPSVPTQDSWSWIVWGREVAQLNLDTLGGSSWKPLPVLFTTIFSFFGDAAPALWIIVSRAGALMALVFAYRIGTRLAGRTAGIVAAVALAGADWLRYVAHGNVEPLSVGLVLGAVDRAQESHPLQAVVLGALAALGRPELWPFVVAYGLYVMWRRQARWFAVVPLLLIVPALWLGGDWWGSGDPFHGSTQASGFKERQLAATKALKKKRLTDPSIEIPPPPSFGNTVDLGRAILVLPVEIAALAGLLFAVWRRHRATLVLAGGAAALIVLVGLMSELGYGGSPRFLFPALALVCVLAGVGVECVLRAVGGGRRALAVGVVLLAATTPFAVKRVQFDAERVDDISLRADLQDGLDHAIESAGGPGVVLKAGHPRVNGSFGHQLAWRLKLPMRAVGPLRYPAVIVAGPSTRVSPSGAPRVPESPHVRTRELASVDGWTITAVRKVRGPKR